jgi:hypothetical protein
MAICAQGSSGGAQLGSSRDDDDSKASPELHAGQLRPLWLTMHHWCASGLMLCQAVQPWLLQKWARREQRRWHRTLCALVQPHKVLQDDP